jgi:hypothetical protein
MIRRRRGDRLWVIFAGATPTSFRAQRREILLPTLRQLQRTQPDVSLKWFERNRVWSSPQEAQDALIARGQKARRPPAWRPGGEHRDPRERFQLTRDQKRARFKARQRRPAPGRSAPSAKGPKSGRGSR